MIIIKKDFSGLNKLLTLHDFSQNNEGESSIYKRGRINRYYIIEKVKK